ncbi:Mediator of RNA polymerase II transcription subunit 17 [Hypsizygus marmoreus]|uniref:Mediator of RNA polymerase II transcription subunit 17 n=1 Tax=Hypsizygus marmoreus TaxID=39966 RepID=A0A369JSL0_HYPMA|nr:Mediator of RNA polymerase II transcription subunit 17 [Hypsizygus marmoreus]
MDSQDLPWKQIKLSLERPYKDDNGDRIPVLFDISSDGQHIYEPKESSTKILGENLRRIFTERGVDFFDRVEGGSQTQESSLAIEDEDKSRTPEPSDESAATQSMTVEELFKMRMEILPQLYISLGEMSHARDLLTSLLASPQPQPSAAQASQSNLSATVVSKPPPIISVQAFNSQLTIGSKDEALRKAAHIFKSAADSMERGRIQGEKYWIDALKVRRANWGLIPAPLPFGAPTGKGADKTSKDFLISYGLEESPAIFRRQAVARMATQDSISNGLVFLHRQHTRLRVSVAIANSDGNPVTSHNTTADMKSTELEGALKSAQQEVVEQEIFSILVQEAGNLPTASARVSERLIVIDAAQGTELKFELLDSESRPSQSLDDKSTEKCNLIYFALHALLLRRHAYLKERRLGAAGIIRPAIPYEASQLPPILQPIIDLLQYQVFCQRIKTEIDKMAKALSAAGISSTLRFDFVGETGRQLVRLFENKSSKVIGGEAVLRIDNRHTIRLSFLSPSSLTAHLPQATLTISSIPQLCQLLTDEVERWLLQRICELGNELCDEVGGTWFVDLSRCVGRWEGCVLNFHISYGKDFAIDCSAFQIHKGTSRQGQLDTYSQQDSLSLLSWIENVIKSAPLSSS